jgi:hypothetical protein
MQEEEAESPPPNAEMFKGVVAFKLQAVKVGHLCWLST